MCTKFAKLEVCCVTRSELYIMIKGYDEVLIQFIKQRLGIYPTKYTNYQVGPMPTWILN
jgi:hypothetical protein